MSIIITNVSPPNTPADGLHHYVVRINNGPVIAEFDHYRPDGLADCLLRAAYAVKRNSETEKEAAQ